MVAKGSIERGLRPFARRCRRRTRFGRYSKGYCQDFPSKDGIETPTRHARKAQEKGQQFRPAPVVSPTTLAQRVSTAPPALERGFAATRWPAP